MAFDIFALSLRNLNRDYVVSVRALGVILH